MEFSFCSHGCIRFDLCWRRSQPGISCATYTGTLRVSRPSNATVRTPIARNFAGTLRIQTIVMSASAFVTGCWTDASIRATGRDSKIEPGTGRPTVKGQLSGRLLRMLMILGDADGDGAISPKEMQSIRDKVFKGHGAEVDQKSPPSNK